MVKAKRVVIATLCGIMFGIVCIGLAGSNPDPANPLTTSAKWLIVSSRTLMGFMIGISALRMGWWLHGMLLGFIASIPMAIPVLDQPSIAMGTLVMGIIYGILIELITSVLLKAKAPVFMARAAS